ncbi:MAG: HlyD family efflux transporter periplasmic adaptor subunit [Desulfobacteraceae bacterium]|nr:MAG: HlyD family efflux transporter periplasmic adaptor subunit [Desulfobacteraceae bacterium]
MKRLIMRSIFVLVLFGLMGGAAAWLLQRNDDQAVLYRTSQVTQGDLLVSISATGTVQPEEVIDVGAQVAGQILSFGKDVNGKPVDYGSFVEEGTVLARIDDSLYLADAAQAEAQVQSARASELRAEADLEQMKAKLRQAERDWQRAQRLGPSEALAQASYDAYQSTYETAKANVAVGEAAILQAKASLAQAEAVVRRAQRNLGYCTIKSPVKGVIIDRRVNIGQTVVASLNAPSLFLIAKDLKRMQVWVAVNEADIGKIRPGLPVTFTVDAFPGDTFRGQVGKIRLNASMTQNVVTYTVEIITDNSSGRLLPYLTANIEFELNRLNNVLLVPNAALRWTPSVEQVAPAFREAFEGRLARKQRSDGGQIESARALTPDDGRDRRVLWLLDGEHVRPVSVKAGQSDGTLTEVEGEGLEEGLHWSPGSRPRSATRTRAVTPLRRSLCEAGEAAAHVR